MALSDEKIRDLLSTHGLPTDATAVARVREDYEIAEENWRLIDRAPWSKRNAERLQKLLTEAERLAEKLGLIEDIEKRAMARVRMRVEIALLAPRATGPEIETWIWPFCINYIDTWRLLRGEYADPDTPTTTISERLMSFLLDCCLLIDPGVTPERIRRAQKHYASEAVAEDDWERAYAEWCDTELGRKWLALREPLCPAKPTDT
ncbi:MAG: hypothetical protein AB7O04_07800 [Hyphomonadaceae bacterium]